MDSLKTIDHGAFDKGIFQRAGEKNINNAEKRIDGCQSDNFYLKLDISHFFADECVTPFLRSRHNHFDDCGNYIPGFCGGIKLGDCKELDRLFKEGIDTEQYPILGFLIDNNMEGLYDFAKNRGYTDMEEGYLSKCHLCMELIEHLILHGDFKELKPKEFYLHLE